MREILRRMPKGRTQLNINIDPSLLLSLKSEAIKRGQTLTEFVTSQLEKTTREESKDSLEARLSKIESLIFSSNSEVREEKKVGTIFTDEGAKEYGKVAKEQFESHMKKKGLPIHTALEQIANHLKKYPYSNPELIFQILLGTHDLTGLEMTNAYRNGSCAMRAALNDWTNDPLEPLNKAFLNAVVSKSLV